MKSKLEVVEAENARLKRELEEKKELTKSLLDVIGAVNQRQVSPTNMEPLLAQIKLVVDGFVSLNRKVDEVQQNITQPPGTHVYAQPQHNRLTNQGSQAAATTLPVTQPAGTSRTQQTFQSPGTFTENSDGFQDSLWEELLDQTSPTIDVSPEFRLSPPRVPVDDFFSEARFMFAKIRKSVLVQKRPRSTGQTILSPSTKEYSRIAASLAARNDPLKPEIQEKQEPCQEEQLMKSNIGAFEAANKRLKDEIKERERRMKFNLRAFLVDYRIFMNQIEAKGIVMITFENEKGRLEHDIEEQKRLMKSNMEAFEAKNGHLKLEIGEKEQPMKYNLEAFEAQNASQEMCLPNSSRIAHFDSKEDDVF
ncbi:hypothetical protein SLEP1_g54486 [Rubroshorea leprosula]|uniref:Uncharacterized protein n=1 Tax=Rubroshorea leprosula TaxID=152421 RepID=A0AAV5MFF9_9ROSI|nr:hypothetical protein SLEP1_g54486 [Rubroshorea leprosula]